MSTQTTNTTAQSVPSTDKTNKEVEEKEEDDRPKKDVVAPPRFPLDHNKLFHSDGTIDLEVLGEHLNREGRLSLEDATYLIEQTAKLFKKEPNLLRLKDPLTICGDIHGQFFDLLRLMEAGGDPAETQYLFLGDYVDRGCFSTECVFYLCAHKITYPDTFFMIRGNHECRHLTSFFNFKDECLYKYNIELYDTIMSLFDNLPISAIINGKFLCCHGGLSPDISTLADIEEIDRFQEVPKEGPFCDLLWADPVDDEKHGDDEDGHQMDAEDYGDNGNHHAQNGDNNEPTTWFAYNETRQCSYIFGIDAVTTFLKKNQLTAVIRAHEAQFDGYKMQMINENTHIPRVITIFSAPNYCDVYKNKGACLKFDDELLNIRQFVSSPHPYYLPNFMDVFTWSLPFVAEKVTDMLYSILTYEGNGDDDDTGNGDSQGSVKVTTGQSEVLRKKGGVLKDKVIAVTKLMRMYKTLQAHQKQINEIKLLLPQQKLPSGLLQQGSQAIEKTLAGFREAKKADRVNEVMPDSTTHSKKSSITQKPSGPIFFRKQGTIDNNNNNNNQKDNNKEPVSKHKVLIEEQSNDDSKSNNDKTNDKSNDKTDDQDNNGKKNTTKYDSSKDKTKNATKNKNNYYPYKR